MSHQEQQHHSMHHQMQSQHVNSNSGANGEYHTEERVRESHENTEKLQEKQADQYLNQSNIITMAQSNESLTGNFLLHSHHPRVDSLPDGGGLWEWSGGGNALNNNTVLSENGITAIESFIKFGSEEKSAMLEKSCEKQQQQQATRQHEQQELWKEGGKLHENQTIDDKSFQRELCMEQAGEGILEKCQKTADNGKKETESGVGFPKTPQLPLMNDNERPYAEGIDKTPAADGNTSNCDISPTIKQENILDYGCSSNECAPSPAASSKAESCLPKEIKIEPDQRSEDASDYKFRGDGGPAKVSPGIGSWCCRRGGTEQPTPEHLRDGCCQGLQTRDEILADAAEKTDVKSEGSQSPRAGSVPSTTKLQDHLEKLKNNVRTEVPDCNCFPADKCELLLRIQHDTNIERTH